MGFVASLTLHKQHHPLLPACPSGGLYTHPPPTPPLSPSPQRLCHSGILLGAIRSWSTAPASPPCLPPSCPELGGCGWGSPPPWGLPTACWLQRPVLGGTTRRAAGRRDSKATARGRCEACKTWCLSGVCRTYQQALTGILA